jgi:hydrogenase maturation protease
MPLEQWSMSVSAKGRPLIIGIGNPLRSDDGLGWAVAGQLAQDCHTGKIGCDIHTVHQLTPELAQVIAAATLVVLIDASREGEPGELQIRPLSLSAQPGAVGTHHTTPEELAALTVMVYGQCPPIVVVSLTGADFSLGEHLSTRVAQSIPLVSATVWQCILTHSPVELESLITSH